MKIGLPRALLFFYYYPLWKKIFETLGMEVVLSDETNKALIEDGIKVTVSEFCVPIKVFNGHVIDLLKKDVDFVFVPRFVSVDGEEWFCPKFLGLPDAVQYTVDHIEDKMLTIDINGKREDTCELKYWLPICEKLGVDKSRMKNAIKAGREYWIKFRKYCMAGYTVDEALEILDGGNPPDIEKINQNAEITIGLIGYVYNIYDKFISMDAVKRLRAMNVKVVTFEMFDERALIKDSADKDKSMFWIFTRKLHYAVRNLLKKKEVDGIIHMTAFACGPDSVVGKYFEEECEEAGVPFMTTRLDEHTGESHIQTRLEAFTDMIKIGKYRKGQSL